MGDDAKDVWCNVPEASSSTKELKQLIVIGHVTC